MKPLKCAVYVLHMLSSGTALGEGIGLVHCRPYHCFFSLMYNTKSFPPARAVFAAFVILLTVSLLFSFTCPYPYDTPGCQAASDVSMSYDTLVDLFESIEIFLCRLDIYTRIPLTAAMAHIVIKILTEVLATLALATRQVKQGRLSEFFRC